MMDMLAADLDKEITKWRLRRRMPRLKKGLLKVHQKGFLVYRFFVPQTALAVEGFLLVF